MRCSHNCFHISFISGNGTPLQLVCIQESAVKYYMYLKCQLLFSPVAFPVAFGLNNNLLSVMTPRLLYKKKSYAEFLLQRQWQGVFHHYLFVGVNLIKPISKFSNGASTCAKCPVGEGFPLSALYCAHTRQSLHILSANFYIFSFPQKFHAVYNAISSQMGRACIINVR